MLSLTEKITNPRHKIIISLDGTAGSGKSTIGKLLSEKFQLKYFESGLLYRNVALKCLNENIDLTKEEDIINLARQVEFPTITKNLYHDDVADLASKIATILEVRKNINHKLKLLLINNPRVIMEGRDIGTNVAPHADLKIFITANIEKRAERRFNQLINSSKECIMSELLISMDKRDSRDQQREHHPLQPAKDALIIDSSNLDSNMVIDKIIEFLNT